MSQNDHFDNLKNRLGEHLFEIRLQKESQINPIMFHFTVFGVIARLLGIYKRGVENTTKIQVTHNTFALPSLPEHFENYKILHLSDLHADLCQHVTPYIIEKLAPLEYDLCVITGDFITKHLKKTELALAQLEKILLHIKVPCLGVLGNHDKLEIVPKLEALGMQVLLNEVKTIEKAGQQIYIAGVDDPSYFQTSNIPKVANTIPPGACSILLAHSTCIFNDAEHHGFDILLAGHCHGGQLCLPGGISVINNSRSPKYMVQGAWQYGGLKGYTSSGLGCCGLPLRYNCPPEIVVHTLVSSSLRKNSC